ncbi:hypothetical protein ACHAPA_012104 [Fusarium lateritium]
MASEDRDLIFTASVSQAGVSPTFVQFRNSAWDVEKTPSKRLTKPAASKLLDIIRKDIPVLDKITQPFDKLYFMYVQKGVDYGGFTKTETILYNPWKKDHDAADVVVEAGCHFVLAMKDMESKKKVVVASIFARPKREEKILSPALALKEHVLVEREYGMDVTATRERLFQDGAQQQNPAEIEMANKLQGTKGDGSTGKAALKKTNGPLFISNIELIRCVDASVVLGLTTLDLGGFSIGLDLNEARLQRVIQNQHG